MWREVRELRLNPIPGETDRLVDNTKYTLKLVLSFWCAHRPWLWRQFMIVFFCVFGGVFAKTMFELSAVHLIVVVSAFGAVIFVGAISAASWLFHVVNECKRLNIKFRDVLSSPRFDEIRSNFLKNRG
jgi:hypothetical protein